MFIAVPALMLWYTAHAVLSRFAGTCTMGDTDRFVAGMIVGMPAAAVAVIFLRTPARTGWQRGAVVATGLLAVVVLCLWVPLAVSAGIQGHHLCGPQFDEYLSASYWWERFIPILHVVLASTFLILTVRTFIRAWRAAQPGVEPDGRLRGRGLTP